MQHSAVHGVEAPCRQQADAAKEQLTEAVGKQTRDNVTRLPPHPRCQKGCAVPLCRVRLRRGQAYDQSVSESRPPPSPKGS
eukprot:12503946-Alexandrium_andersonii.AAC.1